MKVPRLEKTIGIEVYATNSPSIGGAIRQDFEDFTVEEMLVDGSKATIRPTSEHGPLISSDPKNPYLLCVLVKRNWDTLSAIKTVASRLGISADRIQACGLKDARALTAQHVTIEGASFEDARKVRAEDLELRPVGYSRFRLSSYYLLGNRFRITVGSIGHRRAAVEKRIARTIEELKLLGGMPNFFGHQRFGTIRPMTHLVGKAIVKGSIRKAAMLFLTKSSPYEHPSSRKAREELSATHDFKQAFEDFPSQLRYERLILDHLVKKPDDYVGSFRRLPVKLQELFVQAYQSYLFNRFLSRRIESGVPLKQAQIGEYVVGVERSGLPMLMIHETVNDANIAEINAFIEAGRKRLALPLVGFKQRSSGGFQGEIERKVLEDEGISPEDFRIAKMPEISLKGQLRTALTTLNDFSVEKIVETPANSAGCEVEMSFMLYRSSYATVLLRELMKPRDLIGAGF